MDEHGRYFEEHFVAGRILLFGPVMATSGAFGLAVLEVDSEEEAKRSRQSAMKTMLLLCVRAGER